MPRLILIARVLLLALWVADNEAILVGMLSEPCCLGSISKGVINGIAVDDKSRLVLGEAGTCRIGISGVLAVLFYVVIVDYFLIVLGAVA